jgi:hypothetical protein
MDNSDSPLLPASSVPGVGYDPAEDRWYFERKQPHGQSRTYFDCDPLDYSPRYSGKQKAEAAACGERLPTGAPVNRASSARPCGCA